MDHSDLTIVRKIDRQALCISSVVMFMHVIIGSGGLIVLVVETA
jgi:hypothetical protein